MYIQEQELLVQYGVKGRSGRRRGSGTRKKSNKKVDKTKNMSNIAAWGPILQNSGAFDYLYSQKLEGDNYAYFYTDNEKNSTRNPKWILGVITQVDGKYSYEKIPMTTEKGQIYPVKAKNGYILLREVSDKKSTIRLEKINY